MHLTQSHIEIGSSVGIVAAFIVVILWIAKNMLSPALGYVGALMVFVVLIGMAGIWMAKTYNK